MKTWTKFVSAILMVTMLTGVLQVVANKENKALGKSYTITEGEPVSLSYANYEPEVYGIDEGRLTDGRLAAAKSSDGAWYRAMRGRSRIVTIDLGGETAVSEVTAGFLHSRNEAYYIPKYMVASLSADGSIWQTVKRVLPPFELSDTRVTRAVYDAKLDATYNARYVRVEFAVDIFACCDEICVYGDGTGKQLVPDAPAATPAAMTDFCGASDIVKIYNGYYPDQELADCDEEELLPYVAYLDKHGNITDTMFDGIAFVPCHTDYPSGGRLTKTSNKPGAVMSDWVLYLENTFKEGYNLHALESAVKKTYEELNIDGEYPVLLTIPFPTVLEGKQFGDINGIGIPAYCQTLAERVAIVEWYVNECISRFNAAEFEKLRLVGFYWYREEVNCADTPDEEELVKASNAFVHSLGLKTLFDPFYLSSGYDSFAEYGFDACVMQPNYAEIGYDRLYFKKGMLAEFAQTVINRGCGVEIETRSPGAYSDSSADINIKNYLEYMAYGVTTGYMGLLKTYYQGAGPGSIYDFCKAKTTTTLGAKLRRLYDVTYKFIKGTLTAEPPVISIEGFTAEQGKRKRQDITVTDADSATFEISVEIIKEPEHGNVTVVGGNSSVSYRSDEEFLGTDSFTVVATDGVCKSEPVTVEVTVVPVAESQPESESSEEPKAAESSQPQPTQPESKPMPWWPWLLLGLAVVGAAVYFIIKRVRS